MGTLVDMTGCNMREPDVSDYRNTTGRVCPRKNIIGKKFGMITVLYQTDDYIYPNGQRFAQYYCQCDCGVFLNVIGVDLTRSETDGHKPKRHCGCQTAKNISDSQRKHNAFRQDGDVIVGITSNTDEEFYIDIDDFDLIKDYCWFVHTDQTGYRSLVAKVPGTDRHIKMTALLCCKGYDHIDRNPLNNRRNNLRLANQSQQMLNRSVKSNNKSGVSGVWYVDDGKNRKKRWYAELKIDKKRVLSKFFATKEEAIVARLQAEADYAKEFAPQKHLFEQYKINVNEGEM